MKPLLVGMTMFVVVAATAPAPAQCWLDFEDLPLGAELRVPDPPWVTHGVPIDGEEFFWLPSGSTTDGYATVQDSGDAGGSGNEVATNNINLEFGLPGPISDPWFLFGEYGGNLNIEINGDFRNFQDMQDIDGTTIGGVNVLVTDYTGGAAGHGTGRVDLFGMVSSFSNGGQEYVIDCFVPEPASAAMLGLCALLCLRRRRRETSRQA